MQNVSWVGEELEQEYIGIKSRLKSGRSIRKTGSFSSREREKRECLVPGKDGQLFSRKGLVIERDRFEQMKDEFYDLRGGDIATGLQIETNMKALDLGDISEP
jgi:hypothetical protein